MSKHDARLMAQQILCGQRTEAGLEDSIAAALSRYPDYVSSIERIIEAAEDGQDMQSVINELKGLRRLMQGERERG